MPELPEVETTRRKLEPLLLGQTVREIVHGEPLRYPGTALATGQRIEELRRRGKYLIFGLSGGEHELVAHLGMTGGFRLQPGRHTRVTLRLSGGELHFDDSRRFGRLAVLPRGDYRSMPTLQRMGPEPLSDDFDLQAFAEAAARAGAAKPWLLSQRPVAGVGNIYADEALWRSRLHPLARRLSGEQAAHLHAALRAVLAEAVRAGGSTLSDATYAQHDGEQGRFQFEHAVYARAGEGCPRCGEAVVRTVVAGRGTHLCPACQTLESPPPEDAVQEQA